MIERISEKLADAMARSGAVKESDKDIYAYGLEVLLSTAASVLAILALGLCIGRMPETALFLLFFIALRSAAGGFHASTHFRCFLIMLGAYAAAMAPLILLPAGICRWAACPVAGVAVVIVAALAPAPHENRPAGPDDLRRFRTLSLLLVLAEMAATVLLAALGAGAPAMAGAMGAFASAVSLVAARLAGAGVSARAAD